MLHVLVLNSYFIKNWHGFPPLNTQAPCVSCMRTVWNHFRRDQLLVLRANITNSSLNSGAWYPDTQTLIVREAWKLYSVHGPLVEWKPVHILVKSIQYRSYLRSFGSETFILLPFIWEGAHKRVSVQECLTPTDNFCWRFVTISILRHTFFRP